MIIGSITAIISLAIIALHFLYKGLRKLFRLHSNKKLGFFMKYGTFFSVLILIIIPVALFNIYKPIVGNMLHNNNNIQLAENALYVCEPIVSPTSNKYVILRLDDVQAYGWTDISIRMMHDALERNETIVAGVIPKNIHDDKRVVDFFKKYDCNVEIAIHGYDHGVGEYSHGSDGEFASLNENEAKERLTLAKNELHKISKQEPVTFIPPNNQLSEGSVGAIRSEILPIISSEGEDYFDYDAATWDFKSDTFVNADVAINDCEESFKKGDDLCVIMLHPQDFSNEDLSIDGDRYNEFIKILDYMQSNNIPAITFKEMSNRNSTI
jgi:hypothetical protein